MQINHKVEYWKNRLLDLGKRNRLINCALPKSGRRVSRTSLLLFNPGPHELWRLIVDIDSEIKFPVPISELYDSEESGQITLSLESEFNNGIKTNQSPVETCKTLRSLMKKSKEFIEEKGLNALYLAFGFLNWRENGIMGLEIRSPLLLIPVTLLQDTLNDPIVLSRLDEEIIMNNALEQKLLNDFGISLPSFDETIDWQLYLSKVQDVCNSLIYSDWKFAWKKYTCKKFLKSHILIIEPAIIRDGKVEQLLPNEFRWQKTHKQINTSITK